MYIYMVIIHMTNCEHRLSSNGVKGGCSSRQPCMRAITVMYTKRCRHKNIVRYSLRVCKSGLTHTFRTTSMRTSFTLTVQNRANDKYDHMLPGLQKGKSAGEFLI
jgi:hypothetical protein